MPQREELAVTTPTSEEDVANRVEVGSDDDDEELSSTPLMNAEQGTVKTTINKKPPRKRFVIINTSKCRYHIVRQAALELGWCIEDEEREDVPEEYSITSEQQRVLDRTFPNLRYRAEDSPQVYWVDTSVLLPRVAALRCFQRLNHFPNMHVICRKMLFFSRCMKLQHMFPEYFTFFPISFSLKSDFRALDDYFRSLRGKTKTFVMKPNTGCQGKGIVLTRNPLKMAKKLPDQDYIVQLYVHRPLLIEGKKFDMRVYVLMTMHNVATTASSAAALPWWTELQRPAGLQVYVHTEGLVRICSEPYSKPTSENLSDVYRHLTNYALNKDNEGYVYAGGGEGEDGCGDLENEGDGTEGFSGNKRDFRFLEEFINKQGQPTSRATATTKSSVTNASDRTSAAVESSQALGVPEEEEDDDNEEEEDAAPRSDSALSPWEQLQRRVDRAVVLSLLSGIHDVRQAYQAAGAMGGQREDSRNSFELMGFDIMMNASGQVFVLEINHSPSLCCDTPLDVRIKKAVIKDTLRISTKGVPDIRKCSDGGYRRHNEKQAAKERSGPAAHEGTGFRQVFPLPVEGQNGCGAYTEVTMEVYREVWEKTRVAAVPSTPITPGTVSDSGLRRNSSRQPLTIGSSKPQTGGGGGKAVVRTNSLQSTPPATPNSLPPIVPLPR